MILVMRPDATLAQIDHAIERVTELGFTPHVSRGESRTVIGVIGDETKPQAEMLEAIPGLEKILARWGVQVTSSVVKDPANTITEYDVIVSDFSKQHPVVNPLLESCQNPPKLLLQSCIDDDGYRTVVDKTDLHIRAELAGLNGFPKVLSQTGLELFIKWDG